MKQLLKKCGQWIKDNKKALLIVSLLVFFSTTQGVYAIVPASSGSSAGDSDATLKVITELVGVLVHVLTALLWPIMMLIGKLMDVDLIIGPGMEQRLQAIWVQFRNLVNIAFVLFLLVVAFYNILGLGGGEGELAIKTALPKIVLGLVLVNFTFIAGKVILDVVNVGTTIAFGIPQLVEDYDMNAAVEEFETTVCYHEDKNGDQLKWAESDKNVPTQTELFCKVDADGNYAGLKDSLKSEYFANINQNNIGLIIAVNMGSLDSLNILKSTEVNTFTDLTVNFIFALVMYFVFVVSYLVLGIVLITRVMVLWIAMALSPLAVFFYVVPQAKEWIGGGGDYAKKVIKQLVSPIIIGVTLSMGYLLMDAWNINVDTQQYGGSATDKIFSENLLISGISDLPKFLIAITSVLVIWTGVFAAASDTFADGITGKIKELGESLGGVLVKAPLRMETLAFGEKDKPTKVAPLSAMSWASDQLNNLKYGTTAGLVGDKNEFARIMGERFPGYFGGDPGTDLGAGSSANRLFQNANQIRENEYKVSNSQLKDIARDVLAVVNQSGALAASKEQTKYSDRLKTVQSELASNNATRIAGAYRDLQKITGELTNEKLGIKEMGITESTMNTVRDTIGNTRVQIVPDAPVSTTPTPPATESGASTSSTPASTTVTTAAPATDPATTPATGPATTAATDPATTPATDPATTAATDPATTPATDPAAPATTAGE